MVTQVSTLPCKEKIYKGMNNGRWRSLVTFLGTNLYNILLLFLYILFTNQFPSLVFLPYFKYLSCIFPLLFLTILIPSYSLSYLLQCIPLYKNYFLEDYQWSLPAKLLTVAFPQTYSSTSYAWCYKPHTREILLSSGIFGKLFKDLSQFSDTTSLLFSSWFLSEHVLCAHPSNFLATVWLGWYTAMSSVIWLLMNLHFLPYRIIACPFQVLAGTSIL